MFTDDKFQVRGSTDKRGRQLKPTKHVEDMRKYYRLTADEQLDAKPEPSRAKGPAQVLEMKEASLTVDKLKRGPEKGGSMDKQAAQQLYLRARGLAGPESSSSEEEFEESRDSDWEPMSRQVESSSDDASSEADEPDNSEEQFEEMKRQFGVGALAALQPEDQGVEQVEQPTRRLAIVDQDWQHMRAVDLLAVLRSFCGNKGRVERVTVYPSDYGLERMREESVAGPRGIFKGGRGSDDGGAERDGSGDEVDKERLRFYERSRLRYYYAVAEMDSVDTASRIYDECDGIEFEHSACRLDLRFVPDSLDLTGRQVRDSADGIPADYEAPVFHTKALTHSNVQLTWDADDAGRKKAIEKAMTEEDLKEDDINAFLASDDSSGEESEDPEALRQRYRSLLGLSETTAAKSPKTKDWVAGDADGAEDEAEAGGARKDEDMEMEVTFTPSMEALGKRLKEKKASAGKGGDTVWEQYLRKKKEKRARKKVRPPSASTPPAIPRTVPRGCTPAGKKGRLCAVVRPLPPTALRDGAAGSPEGCRLPRWAGDGWRWD